MLSGYWRTKNKNCFYIEVYNRNIHILKKIIDKNALAGLILCKMAERNQKYMHDLNLEHKTV